MNVLVTAGPTREHIDPVRFITNASSGRMGYAVASACASRGHDVTLLSGPVSLAPPEGVRVERFVSCHELKEAMERRVGETDAIVMTAAVGDFRPEVSYPSKLHRRNGPLTVRLYPTEDVLAGVAERRRPGTRIVAFSVEDGPEGDAEVRALEKMRRKGADLVVVNLPEAMDAPESLACILGTDGVVVPWQRRPKERLAAEIARLLET
jgi:phosphopantothenoylcysteine decarboxylase/phosphopantothenate--cysteine ligase